MSALHIASLYGLTGMVRILVRHRADVNLISKVAIVAVVEFIKNIFFSLSVALVLPPMVYFFFAHLYIKSKNTWK